MKTALDPPCPIFPSQAEGGFPPPTFLPPTTAPKTPSQNFATSAQMIRACCRQFEGVICGVFGCDVGLCFGLLLAGGEVPVMRGRGRCAGLSQLGEKMKRNKKGKG